MWNPEHTEEFKIRIYSVNVTSSYPAKLLGFEVFLERRDCSMTGAFRRPFFFLVTRDLDLRRAFTDLEVLRAPDASVVFGVPAFNAGWEMDSMANNVAVMREESVRNVYFCGADNPKAAADVLDASYQGLQPG